MIPPNAMQLVKDLHAAYVARTGYAIAYNMARENVWRDWCAFGNWAWTCEDLARVIGYLRAKIRKGDRNEGALKFANLIGRPDNFEEDLNLAREAARQVFGGRPKRAGAPALPAEPEESPMDAAEAARLWKEQFGRAENV
jgi:hypothetical protein